LRFLWILRSNLCRIGNVCEIEANVGVDPIMLIAASPLKMVNATWREDSERLWMQRLEDFSVLFERGCIPDWPKATLQAQAFSPNHNSLA
jgi:hypothetical protein